MNGRCSAMKVFLEYFITTPVMKASAPVEVWVEEI